MNQRLLILSSGWVRRFLVRVCEATLVVESLAGIFFLLYGRHSYQLLGIQIRLTEVSKPLELALAAFVLRSLIADRGFWLFRLPAWPLRRLLVLLGVKNRDGLSPGDGIRMGMAAGILIGVMAAIQYRYALPRFSMQAGTVALAALAGLILGGLWLAIFYQGLRLFTRQAERIFLALTFSALVLALMVYFQRFEAWGTEPIVRELGLAAAMTAALSLLIFRILHFWVRHKRFLLVGFLVLALGAAFAVLELRSREAWAERSQEAGKPHRRVVFITIDTLRADHVGCYGYSRPTSPVLDQLAANGLRFAHAYSPLPVTAPSHLAMLTGYYPRTLGVPNNGPPIGNPELPSLPRFFQERGFATGAIVSRAYIDPSSLELHGFDYESAPSAHLVEARADETFRRAANWLTDHYQQDFFLWVHFYDPHSHYDPPLRWAKPFTDHYHGPKSDKYWLEEYLTAEDIAYRTALYDGEIAYADDTIGRLLKFLDGLLPEESEPPLILVVADHGEVLGELQYRFQYAFGHGEFLYQSLVHVPLILSWPGRLPAGRVVAELVDMVDLAPTLVELVFPGERYSCQGQSFASALPAANLWPRSASFSQRRISLAPRKQFLRGDQYMVVQGGYKLIYGPAENRELYDLAHDPGEETNLAKEKPELVERLLQVGQDWEARTPYTQPRWDAINPECVKALRGLGYVQ